MSYNNDNNMWDWEGQDYCLEDNSGAEIAKCILKGEGQNTDHRSCVFDDTTTPIKACGDLAYHVTSNEVKGKEVEHNSEPSSQVKRRRMLQFETETLNDPLCYDDMFLRSEETSESLEDAISEMSNWVAGFAGDTPASSNEYFDPSAEGWISDCFNDPEMQLIPEDCTNGSYDVQVDMTEACGNTHTRQTANPVTKLPIRTHQKAVLRGKKFYMQMPQKLASSVVYPFTFIKPCGAHGDMTLKDINQRILNPPKPKQDEQDPSGSVLTSAFSGKPVVGKTKIRTEGGEGSITILRTKG